MASSLRSEEYRRVIARLRQARKEERLTQMQVSKRSGKPQSYVSKVEKGERRIDVVELAALAKIYHKLLDYFIK